MTKFDGLLNRISEQLSIGRGNRETEISWKKRIIYSVCGLMGYTSLWDEDDGNGDISIQHFRNRIEEVLSRYLEMYPEVAAEFQVIPEDFSEEILTLFRAEGIFYHRANRISPALRSEETYKGIRFIRGASVSEIEKVSGLGIYLPSDLSGDSDGIISMFRLSEIRLSDFWEKIIKKALWVPDTADETAEYLRTEPPFTYGYWLNRPDTSGRVSIMRTGFQGLQTYSLYRYMDGRIQKSPLPSWMTDDGGYRDLTNALLCHAGTLPPISYSQNGCITKIRLNYLLPPAEQNFLMLYSWPADFTKTGCLFERICAAEIFDTIKDIFTDLGYSFTED